MKTYEVLAKKLAEAGLHEMSAKAKKAYYHDYLSTIDFPEMQLLQDLKAALVTAKSFNNTTQAAQIEKLIDMLLAGSFDASSEESDEWAASPDGQATLNMLSKPMRDKLSSIVVAVLVLSSTLYPLPRTGLCPSGWHPSNGYCAPSSEKAAPAIPRKGSCPSGWTPSGDYCVKS
jgi:hypothetical protein